MKIKISKQLWESLGSKTGWKKEAMAVPAPSPEVAEKMKAQGLYFLQEVFRTMPHSTQKDIKTKLDKLNQSGATEFFKNLGPKEVVSLPAIYVAKVGDVYEYKGDNYITVDVKEPGSKPYLKKTVVKGITFPAGSTYPGHVDALNIKTGEVVTILVPDLTANARAPQEERQRTQEQLNNAIANYNERIKAIGDAVGVTRLALQIRTAEDAIDNRLRTLESIIANTEKNIKASEGEPLEAYKLWENELKEGIKSGKYNEKDLFDTLLFLYQGNPQKLISDIENNNIVVPESIKVGLLAVARREMASKRIKDKERAQLDREREERIKQKDIPSEIHEEPIQPLTEQEIPGSEFKKPIESKTYHHYIGSLKNNLASSKKDYEQLTKIKGTFAGLRDYIGNLQKGQRSKEFLATAEGKDILNKINEFMTESEMFIKRYGTDIIQEGKPNPRLMGSKGSLGNALLAVSLTKLWNVLKKTVEESLGKPVSPERVSPTETTVPETVSSKQDQITKISNVLWDAFQKRFK